MNMGWCPKCGEPLSNLTLTGFGYCPEHGKQPAEFYEPDTREDERFDTHEEKRMHYDFGGE